MKRILLIISCTVLLVGLSKCDKPTDPKPFNLTPEIKSVINSSNEFGFDLYRKVIENSEDGKNVLVSPLSVSLALSMTYNGAANETKGAFEQTLRMSELSREEINQANLDLVTALIAHDPKVLLEIANSIWYRQEYEILEDFINRNQTYYDAEVSASDFNDPHTIDVINGWVDDKTHHKIEEIIDQINPESFMFLINAIYFKGTWLYEFDKKDTYDGSFYLDNGTTVEVPMMKQEADLNMLSTEKFTSVELPYGKGSWSMFLFLPHHNTSLDEVITELTPKNWNQWISSFTEAKEVDFSMPKFKFAFEQKLNQALIDMGLGVAFGSQADFSDIAPGLPLAISKVIHKTFIEVNEEGTEAAAVTSVEIELTSIGNYLAVNRPFLFAIVEQTTGAILFIGQVLNPSLEE